ncbi:MAG: hypothetical protein ACT4QA_11300 [Panacagrimonas sp.]
MNRAASQIEPVQTFPTAWVKRTYERLNLRASYTDFENAEINPVVRYWLRP